MNRCARFVMVSVFLLTLASAPRAMAAPPAPPAAPGQPADAGEARKRLPIPAPAPGHAPVPPGSEGSRGLPPVQRAPGSAPPAPPSGPAPSNPSAGGRSAAGTFGSGRPSPSQGLSGPQKVERYRELIARSCAAAGADPAILSALMEVEGSGEGAISPAGAMGLMQLMPDKFRPGDDPFDPAVNLLRAAQHIRVLQDRWKAPHIVAAAYFGALDGRGNVTGASDGNITGHAYVARFQAAYQRYGGAPAAEGTGRSAVGERGLASLDLGATLNLGGPLEMGRALPRVGRWVAVVGQGRGGAGGARYQMMPMRVF